MFTLPELNYGYDALEPYIDKETMTIHHTKHHQGYVDKLNKALEGEPSLKEKSIDELLGDVKALPSGLRQAVINNGGGHANHSFFWKIMSPEKTKPEGEFKKMLDEKFGDLEKFQQTFKEKAMGVFGSGWAFLILTPDKKIELKRHSFQNSPLSHGNVPLLGLDVWEHAYYLKYQNKRGDYIDAWWNVVNWQQVGENFVKNL